MERRLLMKIDHTKKVQSQDTEVTRISSFMNEPQKLPDDHVMGDIDYISSRLNNLRAKEETLKSQLRLAEASCKKYEHMLEDYQKKYKDSEDILEYWPRYEDGSFVKIGDYLEELNGKVDDITITSEYVVLHNVYSDKTVLIDENNNQFKKFNVREAFLNWIDNNMCVEEIVDILTTSINDDCKSDESTN